MVLIKVKNNLFEDSAEMDSPISIIVYTPYGRRRVGVKERFGADVQIIVEICSSFFIMSQMYKLISNSKGCFLIFAKK